MEKETICVQAYARDEGGPTPINPLTSTKYIDQDELVYPRYYNVENQKAVVEKLAKLEKAEDGLVFSSGMAAISHTLLGLLKAGDHVILSSEIYGGTHKFVVEEFEKFGIAFDFVFGTEVHDFEALVKAQTKLIYIETPSNPLMTVLDIRKIAGIATEKEILAVIDNTFATPINQNPIELGFDVVIHSGTKYLGGHSDLCFGAVLCSRPLKQQIYKSALSFGGSLNALDCYLIERSLKTLALRVKQQNDNAMEIAQFLNANDLVSSVYYPGLPSHKNHEIAASQTNYGFGAIVSFRLGAAQKTSSFINSLQLIKPAGSLGGTETILCQPAKTSHEKMGHEERIKLGITDDLIRLSAGIENLNDLTADLNQALQQL